MMGLSGQHHWLADPVRKAHICVPLQAFRLRACARVCLCRRVCVCAVCLWLARVCIRVPCRSGWPTNHGHNINHQTPVCTQTLDLRPKTPNPKPRQTPDPRTSNLDPQITRPVIAAGVIEWCRPTAPRDGTKPSLTDPTLGRQYKYEKMLTI